MEPEVTASSALTNEHRNGSRKQLHRSEIGCQMAQPQITSKTACARMSVEAFHMHPGTSDRAAELMVEMQLKGLGGLRNKQCRPVATGCQLHHGKMADVP